VTFFEKTAAIALFILSFSPVLVSAAEKASCPALTRELNRLRLEYHQVALNRASSDDKTTFEQIAEKIDKIIEVKDALQKANCKIPPRPKYSEPAR